MMLMLLKKTKQNLGPRPLLPLPFPCLLSTTCFIVVAWQCWAVCCKCQGSASDQCTSLHSSLRNNDMYTQYIYSVHRGLAESVLKHRLTLTKQLICAENAFQNTKILLYIQVLKTKKCLKPNWCRGMYSSKKLIKHLPDTPERFLTHLTAH